MTKRKPMSDPPDELTEEEKTRIKTWVLATWESTGDRLIPKLGRMWEACRDWHLSNGVQRANWEATFRRWIRKEEEFAQTLNQLKQHGDSR